MSSKSQRAREAAKAQATAAPAIAPTPSTEATPAEVSVASSSTAAPPVTPAEVEADGPLSEDGAPTGAPPSSPAILSPSPDGEASTVVTMNQPTENETPASTSDTLAAALAEEGIATDPGMAQGFGGEMDDEAIPELRDPDELEGLPPGTTSPLLGNGRQMNLTHVPRPEDLIEVDPDAEAPRDIDAEAIVDVMLDRTLTCDNFEGGPMTGVVENENPAAVQLRLANGRLWPVFRSRITGDTWQHVESDVPKVGEDAAFDAQYRSGGMAPTITTAFAPPAGYVRAWVKAEGYIKVKGYSLKGTFVSTWKKGDEGYFPVTVVDGPKSNLKRSGHGIHAAPTPPPPPKPVGRPIHPAAPTAEAVNAVRNPPPPPSAAIPEDFVRAQVKSPGGPGAAVSAAGRTLRGDPRQIWKHGEIGFFSVGKVRAPRSCLVELPPAAPPAAPKPVLAT